MSNEDQVPEKGAGKRLRDLYFQKREETLKKAKEKADRLRKKNEEKAALPTNQKGF